MINNGQNLIISAVENYLTMKIHQNYEILVIFSSKIDVFMTKNEPILDISVPRGARVL